MAEPIALVSLITSLVALIVARSALATASEARARSWSAPVAETPALGEVRQAIAPDPDSLHESFDAHDAFVAAAAAAERATGGPAEQKSAASPARSEASPARSDFEFLAGGRALNVIGAIVLVIGIGLALKYAFDENWIGPVVRVLGGMALGSGMATGGCVLMRRGTVSRWFAEGLAGAGLGILYLSGFASFASYHFIGFVEAYAIMSVVTLAAFTLAVACDSLPLALVGWAGGFATPFAIGLGDIGEIALASYLLLMDFALIATAIVRERWLALQPLAMAATYFTAMLWYGQSHGGDHVLVSTIAILSLWLTFFAASVVRALQRGDERTEWTFVLNAANAVSTWLSLGAVLLGHRPAQLFILCAIAAGYAVGYALVRRNARARGWARAQWSSIGAGFLLAAASLQYRGVDLTVTLCAVALALLLVERTLRRAAPAGTPIADLWAAAFALLAVAECVLFESPGVLDYAPLHLGLPSAGSRDLGLCVTFGTLLLCGWTVRGFADVPRWMAVVVRQCAVLTVACIDVAHASNYGLVTALATEGAIAASIGTRRMLRDVEVSGIALLGAAIVGLFSIPQTWSYARIFDFVPLHTDRLACSLAVVVALALAAELYRRRSLFGVWLARTLRLGAAGVAIATATTEIRNTFELHLANLRIDPQTAAVFGAIQRAHNTEQLAITATWIAASVAMLAIGIWLRARDFRLGAVALFDITVLKVLFVDSSALEMPYRIASFVGLGLVLVAVSYVYERLERGGFGRTGDPNAVAVAA